MIARFTFIGTALLRGALTACPLAGASAFPKKPVIKGSRQLSSDYCESIPWTNLHMLIWESINGNRHVPKVAGRARVPFRHARTSPRRASWTSDDPPRVADRGAAIEEGSGSAPPFSIAHPRRVAPSGAPRTVSQIVAFMIGDALT